MRILIAVFMLLVAACSEPAADPDRVAQARAAYDHVRDGRGDLLAVDATDQLRPKITPEVVAELRTFTAPGRPESARVVGWRATTGTGGWSAYEINLELEYPTKVVLTRVLMVRRGAGPWRIDGFHLNAAHPAEAGFARFTLTDKSPLHYAVLFGVIAAPALCLITLGVAVWRRRWGWAVASVFGVTQLSLNWATGAWTFAPIYVAILSAGFLKGPTLFDPWILMFSLPLPAALFWILGRHRPKPPRRPARPIGPTPDAPAP